MRLLDHTAATPEENLALDEALLLDPAAGETLRLWESNQPFVVLGRSSRLADEVDPAACAARGVPVLRRVSGGATIVTGPGCLMYAVTLDLTARPELADLGAAHRFVLGVLAEGIHSIEPGARVEGTSDLAVESDGETRKFSGNSLRRTQRHLLYHGTLLYDFDLALIAELLATAPRQPDYRRQRSHAQFVTNLGVDGPALRDAVTKAWAATPGVCEPTTTELSQRLVDQKYRLASWNESR